MSKTKTDKSKLNLFDTVKNKNNKIDTTNDIALYNKNSKTSVVYKGDGSMSSSNGYFAQYKNDKESGVATEISLQSNTITVQKDVVAKDISVNFHKLNSQLYELTNMKQVMDTSIGNLTMMGTVLVKTYEPTLKKWVLMRRQVRMPVFSNLLDSAVVDDRLDLDLTDSYDKLIKYKIKLNNKDNKDNRDNKNNKDNK